MELHRPNLVQENDVNNFGTIFVAGLASLLLACSPIKHQITNQYKLDAYSTKKLASHHDGVTSILVSSPDAVAGYQTEQMLYMSKPFELRAFAHHGWIDPPALLLFPLIVQSLERSGYFHAVISTPLYEQTDYRLDTQLIELQQSFLKKPSEIILVIKAVLTNVKENQVIASQIISECASAPLESPYGGVLAANHATEQLTADLTQFVIRHISPKSKYFKPTKTGK